MAVAERLDAAREAIDKDPNVKALKEAFDATVRDESVRPAGEAEAGDNQELF